MFAMTSDDLNDARVLQPQGLLSRYADCFDDIWRGHAPALTLEYSHRVSAGFPDAYFSCLYLWPQWPIVDFILKRAIDLGKRLGRNSLLLPEPGSEHLYWNDAKRLLADTGLRVG